ncbi:glycosyltransferase family 2 protein [Ponticoccus sp. (in: a-proteobacteria)]|uniref:glycosyltransferase family 2 protein n=1 Tax=Ponticoccus sp. (in: a-proteobacteria) TaxID=1925025 RepID=UPI003AB6CCA6
MTQHRLLSAEARRAQAADQRGQPLSHILIDDGAVAASDMLRALAKAQRFDQPVSHIVAAESLATPDQVLSAQARSYGALALRRDVTPPDAALDGLLAPDFCLRHGMLPWVRLGDTLVLATARPAEFPALLPRLPSDIGPVMLALATEADIHAEIAARHGAAMAVEAAHRVAPDESCRDLNQSSPQRQAAAILAGAAFIALLIWQPTALFAGALLLALGSLILSQGLKLAALLAVPRRTAVGQADLPEVLPTVTILVPLFDEKEIAATLVRRLSRLTYPKALLEVVLVLEAEDAMTRATLARTTLPPWMRCVFVPPGEVTTKPRALNYALRFTRGEIVGIYDAEDAPAPDQIERMVAAFAQATPDVGCLQGILDYYNPRANWLSRCFTIEYASWFRVMLPGLARMGFAVPLGGTSVFLKRAVLDQVGGWDAHNVTEDADLGLRLARYGYRTELFASVTREEANNRLWPWIKQRSRWLKGYGITWWVHTRRPVRLWRALGPKRFLGVQLLFLCTLMQFALAPVLWSFWMILLGLPHPLDGHLTPEAVFWLTGVFLSAEGISILLGIAALARSPHAGLMGWVPTLFAYFPLGTLALYKALWETLRSPFYWDKTMHGRSAPDGPGADLPTDSSL